MSHKRFLPYEEFDFIYSRVPRLNLDLVIRSQKGILLALRTVDPWIGYWHLPGGTVYKRETIKKAAERIAKDETGLDTTFKGCLGYMEFPREIRDKLEMHTIVIAIELVSKGGTLRHDQNASDIGWYKKLPKKIIPEHAKFLKQHGFFK